MCAINDTLGKKDDLLSILQHNIETVLSRGSDKTLADINNRLEELQAEQLKLATSKSDYEGRFAVVFRSGVMVEVPS